MADVCAAIGEQDSMVQRRFQETAVRFAVLILTGLVAIAAIFDVHRSEAGGATPTLSASYAQGVLRVTIPYHDAAKGSGQLMVELLDPEDRVLGRSERHLDVDASS